MERWQQHEQWSEQEAVFCDRMVETMLEHAKEYAAKPPNSYSAVNMQMAYECNIRANVWQQVADGLRNPKRIRLEREAMENEHG